LYEVEAITGAHTEFCTANDELKDIQTFSAEFLISFFFNSG